VLLDILLSHYELGHTAQGHRRVLNPMRLCDDPVGLSGTEVNILGIAEVLARQGHTVRLFSHWTEEATRFYEPAGELAFYQLASPYRPQAPYIADVALAVHDSTPILDWPSGLKVVWHQTIRPPFAERLGQEPVALYLSSTAWNAHTLRRRTGTTPWEVVPNGWDYGIIPAWKPVPGRLFFHTSPERGLHILLRALPLIRARVPEAHLVIWSRLRSLDGLPHQRAMIEAGLHEHADCIELHANGGSRNEVLASLATAACVAYPSEPNLPCEVMPVSLMEACGIGVPVITAPSDQFQLAFGHALDLCPSPPSQYLGTLVEHICRVLETRGLALQLSVRGRLWAQWHTRELAAQRLLHVLRYALERKEAHACLAAAIA
jgi:glycosyltransferase involved in cell wall biosynthesis